MIEIHDCFEPLLEEWEDIAERAAAIPFLRIGCVPAWWHAFGRGQSGIFAVRRDGKLCAVVAMRRGLGVLASASNYHTPIFGFLADDEEAADELARGPTHGMTYSQFLSDLLIASLGWREARAVFHEG